MITLDRKTYPLARVVGYARVSTADQDPQMQIDALHDAGVMDDEMFWEYVSGAAKKRPQLDLAIKALQPGDIFIVWKLDRLARNVEQLLARIKEIETAGARFICLTQAIDTSTPVGRLLLVLLGAVAEFERDLTRERTKRGMQARAERGVHVGRPPKFTPDRLKQIRKLLGQGYSMAAVAKRMKLSEPGIRSRFKIERIKPKKKGAPVKYIVTEKKD